MNSKPEISNSLIRGKRGPYIAKSLLGYAPLVVAAAVAVWLSQLVVEDFRSQKAELSGIERELDSKKKKLDEVKAELAGKEQALERSNAELAERRNQLSRLTSQLQTTAAEVKEGDLAHTQVGEAVIKLAGQGNAYRVWEEGYGLSSSGQIEAAREKFMQALALDESYAPAYNSLGILAARQWKWPEAIKLYLKAWEYRPGYDVVPPNLGLAYLQMNELGEAVRWCIRAMEGKPSRTARVLEEKLRDKKLSCSESDLRKAFYQAALDAQNRGLPAQAISNYRNGCEAGDSASCMLGGRLLADGESTLFDPTEAARLFGRACELGNMSGCNHRLVP